MVYRAILAFVLSMLVIIVYDVFFVPKRPVQKGIPHTVAKQQKEVSSQKAIPVTKLSSVKDLGQEIVVSTPLYKVTFCESGARVKDFVLKKYRQTVDPNSPLVHIVVANGILPLGLRFLHKDTPLDTVYFTPDKTQLTLKEGDRPQRLSFTASLNGLVVKKIFTFYPDDYHIDMDIQIVNQAKSVLSDNLVIFLANKWPKKKDRYGFRGAIFYLQNKFEEIKWKKIKGEIIKSGELQWAGLSDKYFMTTLVNRHLAKSSFVVSRQGQVLIGEWLTSPMEIKSGKQKDISFLLYFGPKEVDRLKKLGYHLDKAVHFGFFDTIAKWLLYVLKWFYKYTHNYGLAIILLTVVIKILFWPLTHMSYESMRRMQKLQPHIQRLREKYKDDKEALNRELMKLYKTYKVNPMGGCLPMLLQIPVFFALYMALAYAIELRHAPFITYLPFTNKLWLADLSAKDPYYITPILMGISMFVQQKITPSTMDPSQAKFMLFMPIIFTFLFLNFPSGLVLYWLVNNLLSIVQQIYVNRKLGG